MRRHLLDHYVKSWHFGQLFGMIEQTGGDGRKVFHAVLVKGLGEKWLQFFFVTTVCPP